jgi:hypothetical protein
VTDLAPKLSVTCVFGLSGSGKTKFALKYLLNVPFAVRWIFDPDGEMAERLRLPPAGTPLEIESAIRTGWVCFQPDTLFAASPEEALPFFCDLALSFSAALPGRKVLVVDEVWEHCSPHRIPPELAAVVKKGRRLAGLESVFLSQEPRLLNEAILSQATEVVSFYQDGPNSLGKLLDKAPTFPTEDLYRLPDLHFIAMNCRSRGILRGRV